MWGIEFQGESVRLIETLLEQLVLHDAGTVFHSQLVGELFSEVAQDLGITREEALFIGKIHDIGKLKSDSYILTKPGTLTPEEYSEIKNHPIHGFNLTKDLPISLLARKIILMHHPDYPYFRLAKNHESYFYGDLEITTEDEEIIAIFRAIDGLEAGTNPKRLSHRRYGNLEQVASGILEKIRNGYYSHLPNTDNVKLERLFLKVIEIRRLQLEKIQGSMQIELGA